MSSNRNTAFTADNCEFSDAERAVLNAAYDRLIPTWRTEDEQGAQSLGDALNNAWYDGADSIGLVNAVEERSNRTV